MKYRKSVAALALALAAGTAGAATATAAPSLDVDLAPGVNYRAYQDGAAAVISIDSGSLIVENGKFQIRAADGQVVAGVPLEFNYDDIAFPIDAEIEGNTARLTPVLDMDRARYNPVALPFEDSAPWKTPYEREVAAWTRMTSTVSMAATVGAVVGAVGAGAIGCLLGGVAGTALTGPLATLFGAGPLAGCLIGAGALAPIGALVGSIGVTGPVAIAAFIQYQSTITAPFPAK
ncbi:hypothetical protein [Nocardia farcinica]|uniref:hypothetical protein n=1 Tax=Nocardia farcinica TaxID=37329 RepID=UPI0024578E75|nr:hypothetical protein [Nocardia farcinica]